MSCASYSAKKCEGIRGFNESRSFSKHNRDNNLEGKNNLN